MSSSSSVDPTKTPLPVFLLEVLPETKELEHHVGDYFDQRSQKENLPSYFEMFQKIINEKQSEFDKLDNKEKIKEIFDLYFNHLYGAFKKTDQYTSTIEKIHKIFPKLTSQTLIEVPAEQICRQEIVRAHTHLLGKILESFQIPQTESDNVHTISTNI